MRKTLRLHFTLFFAIVICTEITAQQNLQVADTGLVKTKTFDTAQYATFYIYRPAISVGGLVGYKIKLNDSVITKIKNNSKVALRIYQEGPAKLTVGNEDKVLNLKMKFGEAYFIKFGMVSGLVGSRPELNLIGPEQGQPEFDAIREKKQKEKLE